nr:PEGA domain-containing protein [Treponemataceae bacterium]
MNFSRKLFSIFICLLVSTSTFALDNKVTFYSKLNDVKLYINDEEIGMLPQTLENMFTGIYTVRVEKKNYATKEMQVEISNESQQTFEIEMEILKGKLSYSLSEKPDHIYVDGSKIEFEKDSDLLMVTAKIHKFRFEKFGYKPIEADLIINADSENKFEAVFEKEEFSVSDFSVYPLTINPCSNLFNKEASLNFSVTAKGSLNFLVSDSQGKTVRKLKAENFTQSNQILFWDGKDENGNYVDDGKYTIEIENTDFSKKISVEKSNKKTFISASKNGAASGKTPLACLLDKGLYVIGADFSGKFFMDSQNSLNYLFPLNFYFSAT